MLLMSLMKRVARKHGFRALLHEKPFAGINGSGKHNNWSLSTDTGVLLHAPGKTAEQNLRFATFIVETLMGVYKHNGLLKASIMSATNPIVSGQTRRRQPSSARSSESSSPNCSTTSRRQTRKTSSP